MSNYKDWFLTIYYSRLSGCKKYYFEIAVKGTTRAYITSKNKYNTAGGAIVGAELVARKMAIKLNKDYKIYD